MSLLSLENVSAAPWGTPLLQDINLQLEAGQIMGIIGPNGAGKSSLLKLISNDLPLVAGSILMEGRSITQWPARERAGRLAVLPQLSLLNFPYRVEEVVQLGRTPHDTGHVADGGIITEVLDAVDAGHLRQRLYTRLSGGEKQRVQLARVLAQIWRGRKNETRLLLLDEPTTALDLAHQQQFVSVMRELAARGVGIVMVVHDFNLLASVASCLLALREGSQVISGSLEEVLTGRVFKQVFGVEVSISAHPETGRPVVISA